MLMCVLLGFKTNEKSSLVASKRISISNRRIDSVPLLTLDSRRFSKDPLKAIYIFSAQVDSLIEIKTIYCSVSDYEFTYS